MNFRNSIIILLCILPFSLNSWGQKDFDAEKTFFDARFYTLYNRYEDALDLYLKLIEKGYGNENIYYLTGKTYLNIPGLKVKSIEWLEKATNKITPKYNELSFNIDAAPLSVWLLLGQAYQISGNLEKARSAYRKFVNQAARDNEKLSLAEKLLASCDTAEKYLSRPLDTEITEPAFLKVSDVNYNVTVSEDGSTLAFMSDARYYHAIYYSTFRNGHWTEPRNITMELESDGNFLVNSLTFDGKALLLSAPAGNNGWDIYISYFDRNHWLPAKPFSKKINSFHDETYAFLDSLNEVIYFVSNRPGGLGGFDLYKVDRTENGEWGNVTNLGEPVNTPGDENTPYVTHNGSRLYYSSNGITGMGGYDVFISTLESGRWSRPVNAGSPPNTTDDDLYYAPVETMHMGFIARFGLYPVKRASIQTIEYFSAEHPRTFEISGTISLPDTGFSKAHLIVETTGPEKKVLQKQGIKPDGTFSLHLKKGKYLLKVDAPGIDPESATRQVDVQKALDVEFRPQAMKQGQSQIIVSVPAILFDFDQYRIRKEYLPELKRLAQVLDSLPEVSVEIQGHTDEKGPQLYNKELSLQRAKAVADFLKGKGINRQRVKVTGLGESYPIAINHWPDGRDCPEGRKLNRRVVFKFNGRGSDTLMPLVPHIPENLKSR